VSVNPEILCCLHNKLFTIVYLQAYVTNIIFVNPMSRLYPICIILIFFTLACKKDYSGWNVYYNSKISLTDVPANESCSTGGVLIRSGLDKNQNDILDSQEVDQTQMICNGNTGTTDPTAPANSPKQIIIQLDMLTANMSSTNPLIVGKLPLFSKHNYPGYDSIVLVASPYVVEPNTVTIKLYDLTNEKPIESSALKSSKGMGLSWSSAIFVVSKNICAELPDEEIDLGLSIVSSNEGSFAGTGGLYLYLYRK